MFALKSQPRHPQIYADPQKSQVIAGLAVHWYSFSEYTVLSRVHAMQPDKFILATEVGGAFCYFPENVGKPRTILFAILNEFFERNNN